MSQQLVQAAHASYEAGINSKDEVSPTHNYLIACKIKDIKEAEKAIFFLQSNEIKHTIFREPDLDNRITAICTETISGVKREKMKRFQLWKIKE